MKYKVSMILILLSVCLVIAGIGFNFGELLMGSSATIKNFIVTFIYITSWTFIMVFAIKNKEIGVVKYCSIFWILTLIFAINTGYVNVVTETNGSWAIPFVILFLTQWYGVMFFVESVLITSLIIAVISLIMSIISIASLFSMRTINRP